MAVNPKPTAGNEARNTQSLLIGKLALGLPINDGVDNIPPKNVGFIDLSGAPPYEAFVDAGFYGATWIDTDEGKAATNPQLYLSAAEWTWNRGTMILRFVINTMPASGLTKTMLGLGATHQLGATAKGLYVAVKNTAGAYSLLVGHLLSSVALSPTYTFTGMAVATRYTLAISWGEAGFCAWLDDGTSIVLGTGTNSPEADTQGVSCHAINGYALGQGFAYTTWTLFSHAVWHWQLDADQRNEAFADPYLFSRTYASNDDIQTAAGAQVCRVSSTGAKFHILPGQTLASDVSLRILLSTNPVVRESEATAITATATAGSDDDLPLFAEATELSPGTRYYWLAQYRIAAGAWINFPQGRGTFVTQRPVGSSFSFAILSDDHANAAGAGGGGCLATFADVAAENAGIVFGDESYRIHGAAAPVIGSRLLWISQAFEDIRRRGVDFTANPGDGVYADGQSESGARTYHRRYRKLFDPLYRLGAAFRVLGNHDGEVGWNQRGVTQKHVTAMRKRFLPAAEIGGENQGLPTEPENGETYVSNVDWIDEDEVNAYGGGGLAKTFFTDRIYPVAAGTHTQKMGLNTSPLGNYYAWSWGDCLFVVLDVLRYSRVHQTGRDTSKADFVLGTAQKTWLEELLASSGATWKVLFFHQFMGGAGAENAGGGGLAWYGRGCGIHCRHNRVEDWANDSWNPNGSDVGPGIVEEQWLHNLCRQHRITACFVGHDHLLTWARNAEETVNYVSCGTVGGLIFHDLEYVHGDLALQGADLGAQGVLTDYSLRGYVWCEVSPATFAIHLVQSSIPRKSGGNDNAFADKNAYEPISLDQFVGQEIAAEPGATTVTLPETPSDVAIVVDEADGDYHADPEPDIEGTEGVDWTDLWKAPNGPNYSNADDEGFRDWDEPFQNGVILFNAAAGPLRVSYAPRVLASAQLQNARPAGVALVGQIGRRQRGIEGGLRPLRRGR